MAVKRVGATAVLDDDEVRIAAEEVGIHHRAAVNGPDRLAFGQRQLDPVPNRRAWAVRGLAAKRGRHDAFGGPGQAALERAERKTRRRGGATRGRGRERRL